VAVLLRHEAHLLPEGPSGEGDVAAENAHAAGRRLDKAEEGLQEGRLAGPVRAEQSNTAFRNFKGKAVDRSERAVLDNQVLDGSYAHRRELYTSDGGLVRGVGPLGRRVTYSLMETTFVLIKPGGVSRNLNGEIIRRIEARNLQIVGLKLMVAPRSMVEEHYAEHKGKGFFEGVVSYLTSGPVVAIAVRGTNAVKAIRTMMGATNPLDAAPGTVRGDFALTIDDNLTHSSSDPEAAERELKLWFSEGLPAG
jgi:nucleoside-diphosphate kinase